MGDYERPHLGVPGLRPGPHDVSRIFAVESCLQKDGLPLQWTQEKTMASGSNIYDSRMCQRYQVTDGVIALDSVYGELIDISFGGLSFRYQAYEAMLQKPVEFGIIFGGETLYFDNVPLLTVTDFVLENEVGNGPTRRRCMQFGQLSHEDLARLARFIRQHAQPRK